MKKKDLLFIIIIVLFGSLIYANSLNNSFVWDDKGHIEQNSFIKDWRNISKLFSKEYFDLTREGFALSWRPLTTLSYFINYSLWGLSPFGYHLSNLLIHLFNAMLIYLIAYLLFQNRRISFLSGLFFISHPINTETVCVISYNENLLACLFVLLAFYLYVKIKKNKKSKKTIGFLWFASNLSYLLALFSKEVAIAFPLIIILYDYCFVFEKNNTKKITEKVTLSYASYIVVTLFYLGIRFFLLQDIQNVFFPAIFREKFLYVGFLKIIVSLIDFLELLIFPINLCAIPIMRTPESLFESLSLISLGGVIFIGIFSFLIYRYSKKIFWSLSWVLLNLLPILTIIPFYHLFNERYLYIPSVGFCILLAIGMDKGLQLNRVFKLGIIFILLFYSWATIKRNNDWKDDLILWSRTIDKYPDNFQAHNNLGCVYSWQGKYDEACKEFKEALRLYPQSVSAWLNLGNVYILKGKYHKAIEALKEVLELAPAHISAHNNLGVCYANMGLYNEAMTEYKKVIKLNPQLVGVYKNIGDLYRLRGLDDEAICAYEYALKLDPQHLGAQYALKIIYEDRIKEDKDKDSMMKEIICLYKKIKVLNFQIMDRLNFRLIENQPYLKGEVEKYLLRDNLGGVWLFETYPSYALNVAEIQESVYHLALICGIDLPEVHTVSLPINGKLVFGSIQRFLSNVTSFCDVPTEQLSSHHIDYIQKHHIFDWFILNHDSTKDNFLATKKGKVIGIDKDSAFNVLNVPSLDIRLSNQNDPVNFGYYLYFWEAYVYKEIEVDFKKSLELIDYIKDIDDSLIKEMFKPAFYVYGKYSPSRYEILIKRKRNIEFIFRRFYKKLIGKIKGNIPLWKGKTDEYLKEVLAKLKKNLLIKEKLFTHLQESKTPSRQKDIRVVSSKKGWYTINALREAYQKRVINDKKEFLSLKEGVLKGLKNLRNKSLPLCEKLALSLYIYQLEQLQKEMNIEHFEQDLIKHITWHPEWIDISALEAHLRVSYRKPRKSLNVYKKMIKKNPSNIIAHLNYIYRPMENKERKESILEYKKGHKDSINTNLYRLIYGILKETDPHFLRVYLEKMDGSPVWKYCLLGRVYRQRGQYKKELHAYQKAITLSSSKEATFWAYTLLGIYYEYNEKGIRFGESFDIDSALAYFKKAIGINPDLIIARLNLANLYIIKQDVEEVIKHFEEIVKREPYYTNLYPHIKTILDKKYISNNQKYLEKYLEEIRMNTLDGEAHYIVGLAYQIKGKMRKAKKHFRKARELGIEN